ncbi:MAG: hypothetical protein SWH54_03920 [Thermodesulfobacteriota bacterium]|nr:hypothetical protein [Thermodesulfobacteriota bacterium]
MSKAAPDINKKKMKKRSIIDRRSGDDRRKSYSLDYFENEGKERRVNEERRKQGERRSDQK